MEILRVYTFPNNLCFGFTWVLRFLLNMNYLIWLRQACPIRRFDAPFPIEKANPTEGMELEGMHIRRVTENLLELKSKYCPLFEEDVWNLAVRILL